MATADFHTLQDADNENIAFVEETATTAPNKRKVGKAHVYVDGGVAPTPPTGASATQVQGNAAAGSPAIDNPVRTGCRAYDPASMPADVDSGDVVDATSDLKGRVFAWLATYLKASSVYDAFVGDSVTSVPPKTSTVNTPAIVTSAGDVLAANAARKSWHIQNLGTNPLFVRLATSASTSVFHMVLEAGVGADDGNGGVWEDDIHTGVVSIAGTSPRCVVMER